jgi:light-regulated signal transduction histidine kinase (bacteriophytochrome)
MASSQVQVTLARVHRQQQDVYIERRRRAFRSDGKWLVYDGYRDVTERERAAGELERRMEELARSNRDLEQFAYMTSHDLSEPLRMIGSYTELLARRYRDRLDDDGREFMGFIVDGVRRMKRLIDDLLAYSRAGRAEAAMQPIPLDEALDEALLNLSRAIDDAGATIERQPLPCVASQRVAMIQLFQNLVGNAIKFRSGRKLVIRVGAEERGASWRFTVEDNGIGIAPKDFERIFVVFQRLHSRSDYDGTGIGLAIAKKIVERHGGRIWVESQPGEGTTFVFTLPRSANADG